MNDEERQANRLMIVEKEGLKKRYLREVKILREELKKLWEKEKAK